MSLWQRISWFSGVFAEELIYGAYFPNFERADPLRLILSVVELLKVFEMLLIKVICEMTISQWWPSGRL